MTRRDVLATAAAGGWASVIDAAGVMTTSAEPGFPAAVAVAVAASLGGGPWVRVGEG